MELVKRGKRTYGAYFDTSTKKIYCAFRNPGEIFLDGKPGVLRTIAQGLQDGSAAWAIDETTLMSARHRGCDYIGVWVKKLNWIFLTPIDTFIDPRKFYRRNYGSKGGSEQRYVSTHHWQMRNRAISIGPQSRGTT